jgi:hypothetical protein
MRRAPAGAEPGPVLLARSPLDSSATTLHHAQRGPHFALTVQSHQRGRATGSGGAQPRRAQPPYFVALLAIGAVALLHGLDITLGGQSDEQADVGTGATAVGAAARMALHARAAGAVGPTAVIATPPLLQPPGTTPAAGGAPIPDSVPLVPLLSPSPAASPSATGSASPASSPTPSVSPALSATPSGGAKPAARGAPGSLLRRVAAARNASSLLSVVTDAGVKLLTAMLAGRSPRTGERVDVILPPTESKLVRWSERPLLPVPLREVQCDTVAD